MKVKWTLQALHDYNLILDFLFEKWGIIVLEEFINITDDVIETIKQNPKLFVVSVKKKTIRKGYLTKHNSIFYTVNYDKNEIVILTIWDNRKDPKKLKY